jgi:hypothetical protein
MDTDVLSIASAYTYMQQTQLQSQIQTQVLRNAMDTQSQIMQELLQGVSAAAAPVNPPYLGNNIDMYL